MKLYRKVGFRVVRVLRLRREGRKTRGSPVVSGVSHFLFVADATETGSYRLGRFAPLLVTISDDGRPGAGL